MLAEGLKVIVAFLPKLGDSVRAGGIFQTDRTFKVYLLQLGRTEKLCCVMLLNPALFRLCSKEACGNNTDSSLLTFGITANVNVVYTEMGTRELLQKS